jgi:hypothetical protein
MDRELARQLVHFVNDPYTNEAYLEYVSYRVGLLKNQLTNAKNMEEVRELQGRISELKRFETLREEVLSKKDG